MEVHVIMGKKQRKKTHKRKKQVSFNVFVSNVVTKIFHTREYTDVCTVII